MFMAVVHFYYDMCYCESCFWMDTCAENMVRRQTFHQQESVRAEFNDLPLENCIFLFGQKIFTHFSDCPHSCIGLWACKCPQLTFYLYYQQQVRWMVKRSQNLTQQPQEVSTRLGAVSTAVCILKLKEKYALRWHTVNNKPQLIMPKIRNNNVSLFQ